MCVNEHCKYTCFGLVDWKVFLRKFVILKSRGPNTHILSCISQHSVRNVVWDMILFTWNCLHHGLDTRVEPYLNVSLLKQHLNSHIVYCLSDGWRKRKAVILEWRYLPGGTKYTQTWGHFTFCFWFYHQERVKDIHRGLQTP